MGWHHCSQRTEVATLKLYITLVCVCVCVHIYMLMIYIENSVHEVYIYWYEMPYHALCKNLMKARYGGIESPVIPASQKAKA